MLEIKNRKSFLELEITWKDNDMFELKITASNGYFYGCTEVYDTSKSLSDFSTTLIDYPSANKILVYEIGKKDCFSYFSMKFYPINNYGHIGVEISIEKNVSTEYREEEKDKLKLEIIIEPSAIDRFQKELFNMAKNETGKSILYGRDNRLDI